MDRKEKVLVLGAGIMGAAIGYELAVAGYQVTIIDREGPCAGATGACNGGISYIGKTGLSLQEAVASLKLYQGLEARLQQKLLIDQSRDIFLLGKTAEDESHLQLLVDAARQEDLSAELLSEKDVRQRMPWTKDVVKSAVVASSGLQGVVDPFSITYGYLKAAKAQGAYLRQGLVQRLECHDQRITGVWVDGELIETGLVVNALGNGADDLTSTCGVVAGLSMEKGVVLVTQSYPIIYPGNVLSVDFMKKDPPAVSLVIERSMHGNLLIGAYKQLSDGNRSVAYEVIASISHNAKTYVHGLEDMTIIRSYPGFRPGRKEGPWLGPAKITGLFMAVGYGGTGITYAPLAAKQLTEMILKA